MQSKDTKQRSFKSFDLANAFCERRRKQSYEKALELGQNSFDFDWEMVEGFSSLQT